MSMLERGQWPRVKAIFQTLMERPEGEWDAGLRDLAADDDSLADQVRALLGAHREGGGMVAAALRQEAVSLARLEDEPGRGGQRVGAYRLLRALGQGGMGEVWLAERADDAFHKQVAVKLVRSTLLAGAASERFRVEREVLARLEHPNIVRILDGGTTADGVPYLVMEYVDGEPIESYCESRALPLDARLRLFVQICSAVEHAHGSLIVHRDIKPSNVLVTADGAVKLLDFGIAKLLDPVPGSHLLTQTSIALATPAFASPEQLAGGAVTTATDIYALGILLYRLLTGKHPYTFASEQLTEVARVIRDATPSRPSRTVGLTAAADDGESQGSRLPLPSPAARRAWCRELRGDLDNIALTALRKEPARRYGSVALLKADVDGYLRGLPVSATPDSPGYRTGKFVRRHRWAIAAAAAAVLGLFALSALALWQARRAAEQALAARAEQRKAEAVSEYLKGILGAADNLGALWGQKAGPGVTVADVLAEAAVKAGRQFAGQPDVEAKVRIAIGQSYLSLGLFKAALEQLTLAREKAFQAHAAPHIDRAMALQTLGTVQHVLGMSGQAEASYRRAIQEYDQLAELPGENHHGPMMAAHYLALLFEQDGRFAAAEALEDRALAKLRAQVGDSNPMVPVMLGTAASLRLNRGALAEAERLYRQALAAFAASRVSSSVSPEPGSCLAGLCMVLGLEGRFAEAEARCEEARVSFQRTLGVGHARYARVQEIIGTLAHQEGQEARAEELLRGALEVQWNTYTPGHLDIARTKTTLGEVLVARGKRHEGEALLREALAARRGQCPPGDWRIGETASALGEALVLQARDDEARPLLQEGFATLRSAFGDGYPLTRDAKRRLDKAAVPRLEKAAEPRLGKAAVPPGRTAAR